MVSEEEEKHAIMHFIQVHMGTYLIQSLETNNVIFLIHPTLTMCAAIVVLHQTTVS